MSRRSYTGESGANAIATHTLTVPAGTTHIDISSLTVSTRAADTAADISITINDDNIARWITWLRSAQVFGGHFTNLGKIPVTSGTCTVVTAAGGASCIVITSIVYEAVVNDVLAEPDSR
jgi:hypothetical protein